MMLGRPGLVIGSYQVLNLTLIHRPLLKTFASTHYIGGHSTAHLWRRVSPLAPLSPRGLHSNRHRQGLVVHAGSFGDDWSNLEPIVVLETLRARLKPIAVAVQAAIVKIWESHKQWQTYAAVRIALGVAALMALATAAANVWGVPAINRQLPKLTQQAAHALGRDVEVGTMRWVAPTGIFGVTPLASVGPVHVGPGPAEKSSASIDQVVVRFSPLESILQGRLVLNFQAKGADVHLKQCDNYSWFGYPDDTFPKSARNFIPGIHADDPGNPNATKAKSKQEAKNNKRKGGGRGGGGGAAGGSSSGGGGGTVRITPKATTTSSATLSNHAAVNIPSVNNTAEASSTYSQSFLDRIAHELLTWQDRQLPAPIDVADRDNDDDEMPQLLLMTANGPELRAQNSRLTTELFRSVEGPGSNADGGKCGSGGGSKFSFRSLAKRVSEGVETVKHQLKGETAKQSPIAAINSIEVHQDAHPPLSVQATDLQSVEATDSTRGKASSVHTETPSTDVAVQDQQQQSTQSTATEEASNSQQQQQQTVLPQEPSATTNAAAEKIADNTAAPQESEAQSSGWFGGLFKSRKPANDEYDKEGRPTSPPLEAKTVNPIAGQEPTSRMNNKLRPIKVRSGSLYSLQSMKDAANAQAQAAAASAVPMEATTASVVEQSATPPSTSIEAELPSLPVAVVETPAELSAKSQAQVEIEADAQPSRSQATSTSGDAPATNTEQQLVSIKEEAAATSAQPAPAAETSTTLSKEILEKHKKAVSRINQLPRLAIKQELKTSKTKAAAAAEQTKAAKEEVPKVAAIAPVVPQSSATRSINSLSSVGGRLPKTLTNLSSTEAVESFSKIVVDSSAARNKGGSKALQAARNWQPVQPIKAAAPTEPNPEEAGPTVGIPTEGAALLEAEELQEGGEAHAAGAADKINAETTALTSSPKSGRVQITHPGYFTAINGPAYTPAPPEALAERRARQRTLITMTRQALGAALSHVQVAVGNINIQDGTLHAYIHGEELPRVFEHVHASVKLDKDYDNLYVNLTADAHERHPSSAKCTMLNPHAHRHLRDVTGVTALRAREAFGDEPMAPSSTTVEPANRPKTNEDGKKPKPTGGRVQVIVKATGVVNNDLATNGPRFPDLLVTVKGKNLHGPLIERIVELPMDINAGRADGEFIIKSHDAASWHYPEFYGRVAVRGAEFHFWDATDDILDANLDLVFEKDRLYFHNAAGKFGSVPLRLTGDMDLDPVTGHYRLSATVPSVEINQLRATLGVRPTPFPVVGAVGGTMHVTGPLEWPVFSGTANVLRPTPAMLADCEPTAALTALVSEPAAVGAYDRVPIESATVVFELDMATQMMTLHNIKGSPVGGGRVQGAGTMWVAPEAEQDPSAVSVEAKGSGLPAESVARRYLPPGTNLPPNMTVGPASVTFQMQGSHLAPVIDIGFKLPEAAANGTARFTREATSVDFTSPYTDAAGTVFVQPPSYEAVKSANTQEEATALAKPKITGCDVDLTLRGLDVMPLVSTDEAAMRQLTQQSGQPVRLRVNGRVKISGKVQKPVTMAVDVVDGDASSSSGSTVTPPPWVFEGDVGFDEVRLNQLKLFKKLKGALKVSDTSFSIHGRGLRPDETLNVNLSLPLLPVPDTAAQQQQQPATAEAVADTADDEMADELESDIEALATADRNAGAGDGSALSLRCGQLLVAADVNAKGSQLDVRVSNLRLDELELASLRGEVQDVSCSLNFEAQTGRGKLSLLGPRYSGLSGESLSGGFRWEKDVVRLEKFVLQQKLSKYEVQGEYVVPPTMPLPTSAADLTRQTDLTRQRQQAATSGRWRLRVDVPTADMQEILPAARLLQDVTSHGPSDYERAKTAFMSTITDLGAKAQELNAQLRSLIEQAVVVDGTAGAITPTLGPSSLHDTLHLPSVRDVKGQWSGSIQAFGGGGGATSCEFDVKGQGWQWGPLVGLETVVANGSYHSEEGVQLQEFVLKSGDAKLLLQGSLLSEQQDASIFITDFPVSTLRPFFRAVPALRDVAPAVSPQQHVPVPSPRPLGMLVNAVNSAMAGATKGFTLQEGDTDSPINGLLYVSGNLGGSKEQPTGEVAVRLYDGAVGATRLAQAQASARLSDNMQLTFNIDVVPAEGHRHSGHVRAGGVVPLAQLDAATSSSSTTPETSATKAGADKSPLDVRLSVRDSGMAILTSMTPDVRWQSGEADIAFRLSGTVDKPTVTGAAALAKATIDCPFLKYPLTITTAEARCEEGMLALETLEAKVGRKGIIRARGTLPIYQTRIPKNRTVDATEESPATNRITVDVQGLELRLRNMYSGQYDALLTVRDSLERPLIGGSMRFSRGTILVVPQNAPDVNSALQGGLQPGLGSSSSPGPSVARVFELLTKGESGLAQRFEDVVRQEVEAVEHIVEDTAGSNVALDSLALQLGPDLRALYPLVMNFSMAGEMTLSGPAHPDQVQVIGTLRLLGGEVNLVATQLELDRGHANTVVFGGTAAPTSAGLDPLVDVVLTSAGGDLRVTITGKASEWAEHLVLQSVSQGGGKVPGDAGEQLDAAEAAKLFESKLKAALLADDGQLALSRLAGTTVSTLMPKIETQGQVGGAKWRLVSAPAIPGLLDPTLADPSNLLSSITMGTEVEVQFGRKLQAAMVRKLRESDVTTNWTLNYLLNSKLRMQFNISSAAPYAKTLMFQYSDTS